MKYVWGWLSSNDVNLHPASWRSNHKARVGGYTKEYDGRRRGDTAQLKTIPKETTVENTNGRTFDWLYFWWKKIEIVLVKREIFQYCNNLEVWEVHFLNRTNLPVYAKTEFFSDSWKLIVVQIDPIGIFVLSNHRKLRFLDSFLWLFRTEQRKFEVSKQ